MATSPTNLTGIPPPYRKGRTGPPPVTTTALPALRSALCEETDHATLLPYAAPSALDVGPHVGGEEANPSRPDVDGGKTVRRIGEPVHRRLADVEVRRDIGGVEEAVADRGRSACFRLRHRVFLSS